MLYKGGLIQIKGWVEVSLPLKNRSPKSVLTLKKLRSS